MYTGAVQVWLLEALPRVMPTIRCVLGWGFTSFIVWGKFHDKQRTYDTKMYPILVCEWVNKWRENKLNVLMTMFLLSSATCIYILYVHTCIILTCTDAGTIHTYICVCVCLRVCACVRPCTSLHTPAYKRRWLTPVLLSICTGVFRALGWNLTLITLDRILIKLASIVRHYYLCVCCKVLLSLFNVVYGMLSTQFSLSFVNQCYLDDFHIKYFLQKHIFTKRSKNMDHTVAYKKNTNIQGINQT